MANLNRVRMERMRADALAVHPLAQREVNRTYLKRLMDSFDLDAVGTIHAVKYPRDGKTGTWIVDGQHRVLALIQLGFGEWVVDVMVHVDVKSDQRAAELFLRLNKRLTVSPFDKFQNEVLAKDDVALGISDVIRKHRLVLGKQSKDGYVACPTALKKSYKLDDGKALDRAIGWLCAAYGPRASALDGKLIEGSALVASVNNGNIEDSTMASKLAKYPGGAPALLGDAKGRLQFHRGSLARSVASLIIDTYNSGRRAGRLEQM